MGEIMTFEPTEAQFGVFWKYLQRPNVTDVDYNGGELWITDLKIGRYRVKEHLSDAFISTFTHNISNCVNRQFNNANKVLEADTRELRISIIHEAAAASAQYPYPKSPSMVRRNIERMLEESYCPERILQHFDELCAGGHEFCVRRRTRCGKRRSVRNSLCSLYRASERVITIEDSLEIHYRDINPGRMRWSFVSEKIFLHGCHQGEPAAESEVACPLGGKVGGGDVAARAVEYRRERLYDDPPG